MGADVVIDETGEVISVHEFVTQRRHPERLKFVDGGLEQAICRLGFAAVKSLRRGLQVFVRPDTLATAALVRLAYLINDCTAGQSVIVLSTWADEGFSHRIVRSAGQAIGLLANMVGENRQRLRNPLSRLAVGREDMPSRLHRCAEAWIENSGPENTDHLTDIIRRETNDRFVTFERIEGSPRFVLRGFGRNNPTHALRWYEGNIGKPLRSDDLDLAYHWFCNSAYRNALALHHPLCELVEAQVNLPSGSRMLRRYHRIILPLYDKGRELVVVATQPQGSG